jgi:hypothetical protein
MSKIRIPLPSGHWWELETRPRWKHVIQWRHDELLLLERALASLTTAWSFGENITPETIARRHEDDMLAILDAFQRHIVPQLRAANPEPHPNVGADPRVCPEVEIGVFPRQVAQQLFAALLTGQVPPTFAEVHLMAATGWSWHTLQDTPADIVNKMSIYLAVTHAIATRGTLDFPNEDSSQADDSTIGNINQSRSS